MHLFMYLSDKSVVTQSILQKQLSANYFFQKQMDVLHLRE